MIIYLKTAYGLELNLNFLLYDANVYFALINKIFFLI